MEYTIGEFAKLCNITPRALKHYEELGLIKPVRILENGYRMYNVVQLDDVSNIIMLKDQGFSLKQIKQMLSKKDLNSHYEILKLQNNYIEESVRIMMEKKQIIEYTMSIIEAYHRNGKSVFSETIDCNIDIEKVEYDNGIIIVINYLTDGLRSGVIFQENGKVIGIYKVNQQGQYSIKGKCICCFSDCANDHDNVIPKLVNYARDNHLKITNIYAETIIDFIQSNTHLTKYYAMYEN